MAYNIKEIIDIAVGIEDAGYEFYTHCAMKFKDAAIRDVFDFLAGEEQRHKTLFQSLSGAGKPEGVFTEEYFAYLKAIGSGRIFDKHAMTIDQVMADILNQVDAIKHAFSVEKDSILYYTELKLLYENDTATLSLLNNIIDEERKHIATLLDLLEKIRLTSRPQ